MTLLLQIWLQIWVLLWSKDLFICLWVLALQLELNTQKADKYFEANWKDEGKKETTVAQLFYFVVSPYMICTLFSQWGCWLHLIAGLHLWYQRWDLYSWSRVIRSWWFQHASQSACALVVQDSFTRYLFYKHLIMASCNLMHFIFWFSVISQNSYSFLLCTNNAS